jgi:hypothetical protein
MLVREFKIKTELTSEFEDRRNLDFSAGKGRVLFGGR